MPSIEPKNVPIDFERYYSIESRTRQRSALKELRPYFEIPDMVSFGTGMPHPSTWPIDGMVLSIPFADKSVYVPGYLKTEAAQMAPLEPYVAPGKNDALAPHLAEELQYSATYGTKHLLKWLKEHVSRNHNPKYEDWEILCTAGNTDGMDAVLRAVFDREDYALVEEFAYPGLLSPAATMGIKMLGVPQDDDGVKPESLDEILSTWDEEKRGKPRPKALIMVPTCSNPSGITMSEQRKREVLAVCRKWEVLVVEDDPYCFLQIRPNGADSPIVPTFLSLDTEGRVIRIDSFSKIVSPGVRLGYITAHKTLLEKIMNTRESATQCPSGLSIAAVAATLRAWGSHEGFERKYTPYISNIYVQRCYTLLNLLEEHLPKGIVTLSKPVGGMFLWVRIHVDTHPQFGKKTPEEIGESVFQACIAEKVLTVPGRLFKAPSADMNASPEEFKAGNPDRIFMRLSYAMPGPEEMVEGAKRMGRAFRKEWNL